MNDTSPEIAELYRKKLMALSPEERVRRACAMLGAAKALMRAGLREELGPNVDEYELKRRLRERLYGPQAA